MSNIFTVTLPDIGEGVVEGEVIEWLKTVGDDIAQDEPIVSVMTDKATVELPAPYPGKLKKQYYQPGEIAIKDKALYDIELRANAEIINKVDHEKAPDKKKKIQIQKTATPKKEIQKNSNKVLATPAMRKLAKDLGVDINTIIGSGDDGRVTAEDIKKHLTRNSAPPFAVPPIPYLEGDEVQALVGIRKLVSQKMTLSKMMIPHFSFFDTARVHSLIRMREKLKPRALEKGIKLTFMPFFIRALSLSLTKFPQFNASVDSVKNQIVIHKLHNIGIAIKTPMGLIAPVLKNVEMMGLEGIAQAYGKLRNKALAGKLEPHDMKDSTITLSNFGTEGGLWATPIINFPEVAILATAKIVKQPFIKGDAITIRPAMNCSWSFDHRTIDGDAAAAFSKSFLFFIENPSLLL